MISLQPSHTFPAPSHQPYNYAKNYAKSRTIEVNVESEKLKKSPSVYSQEYPAYSSQTRSKILAHLASTSHPFPLLIRNTSTPLNRQDTQDLSELLYLSSEDRWWEIDLDLMSCEECVKQNIQPTSSQNTSFLSSIVPPCLNDVISHIKSPSLIQCPHQTTFSKIISDIDSEVRNRLSCVRINGSFQNPHQVGSAIHNILTLFPNIQNAQIRLPPPSYGTVPQPDRIACHLAFLESSLPKGVALKFQNLLDHQDFLLQWVQVKRKWYQLVQSDKDLNQLNKIQETPDSEGKSSSANSESNNWNRLSRARGYS